MADFPVDIQWLAGAWAPTDSLSLILVDKDSTYADTTHRQHMVPEIRAGRATWTEYSLAMADDKPIPGTVRLLELLDDRHLLVTVTGADVEAFPLLKEWIAKHDVCMDGVIMRATGDHRANGKYKVEIVKALQAAGWQVDLFIEDWAETAQEIMGETGVPTLVVKTEYLDTKAEAGV